jgi:beta-glucanase (GH16 family)
MKQTALLLSLSVLLFSCGSKSKNTPAVTPTNLTLSAVVSTDNSGNVAFTASATNAVSYEFDFGNGIFQTVSSGSVTYRYPSSGNYTVRVVAKSAGGQTASKSIDISVAVTLALIWADEFDAPGAPDPAKWGYDIGAGGWGNNELQYYTNRLENASVSNGTLKIVAKAESYSGSPYTSARLLTKNKFSFKYGKIEVMAKLPAGVGTWPAAWMLGDNFTTVGWPNCGEIDIMEHRGSELNKIFGTVHYTGHSGSGGIGGTTTITNATTAFHKYTAEWNAAQVKFSVDDVPYYTFSNSSSLPFNQNFFMILNVAMGGNFGGSVDPAFSAATMEIDYVRVYQ